MCFFFLLMHQLEFPVQCWGNTFLAPILWGKTSSFSPLSTKLAVDFWCSLLLRKFAFSLSLLSVFIMMSIRFFQMIFFFLHLSHLLMWWIALIDFLNVEPDLHTWDKSHSVTGVKFLNILLDLIRYSFPEKSPSFFACICQLAPIWFVEKAIPPLLNCFCTFVSFRIWFSRLFRPPFFLTPYL